MRFMKSEYRLYQIDGWGTYYRANNKRTISAYREWLADVFGVSYEDMLKLTDRIEFTVGSFLNINVSTQEDVPIVRHWEKAMHYLAEVFPTLIYTVKQYGGVSFLMLACDLRAKRLYKTIMEHYDRYPELDVAAIIEDFDADFYAGLNDTTDIPDFSLETIESEMFDEALENISTRMKDLVNAALELEEASSIAYENVSAHGYIDEDAVIDVAFFKDDDPDSDTWGEYLPRYTDMFVSADVSYKALWDCNVITHTVYGRAWNSKSKTPLPLFRNIELEKNRSRGLAKAKQFAKTYGLSHSQLKEV